jgi:hypothetical protein
VTRCESSEQALAQSHTPVPSSEIDEAQDADPAIASVVAAQVPHAQVVCVGDAAQAIYGWRGATDFLSRVAADHRVQLSQSFRFGQPIADEANVWLTEIGSTLRLLGDPNRRSLVAPSTDTAAILCRTNGKAISEVMAAHAGGIAVALVGRGAEMRSLALAAEHLMAGRPANHPELIAFADWQAVRHYAEHDPGGSDIAVGVRLIDAHGPRGVIAALDACVSEDRARLVVSTAHKARGREWDSVRIAGDFPEPRTDKVTGERVRINREEAMLAYVAVTRAKVQLDNAGLAWIHDRDIGDDGGPPPAVPSTPQMAQPQPTPTELPDRGVGIAM